jgi:hypothetical protein
MQGATLPFVTSISRRLPILMLLLGSHSIPLLRLCIVSPAVVEKCTRVLDQLEMSISFQGISQFRHRRCLRITYTHPDTDNQ